MKTPALSVDILIIRDGKILLGLLTEQWNYEGKRAYGVPGRDIRFGETIGETVQRNILEEFGRNVTHHEVISVNANYALGNHYVGIGVVAKMDGEPKLLLPEDWEKWEWFDTDNLPDNLFPAARNVLDSYLQGKVTVSE
jgi:ADP-ribose pyrophosphatase YjhB (NUDIX family)